MTKPTNSAADQHKSDSTSSSHNDLIAQCRTQRREMLQQWDDATEKVIGDYESSVIAVRVAAKSAVAASKKQLANDLEQLQVTADVKRMQILQRFDSIKSEPKTSEQNDDREIQTAYQKVQAEIKHPVDWLNNQSISLPDQSDAIHELGLTSPHSVQEAVQTLAQLSRLGDQVTQEVPSGIMPTLVGGFLLPLIGGLIGLAVAAAAWLVPSEPSLIIAAVALILPTAIGIIGHVILRGPLKLKAGEIAPKVALIRDAAEHCVTKAKELSKTQHSSEAKQLTGSRDTELAKVEDWLSGQQQELQSRHHAIIEQSKDHMLEELQDLDSQFAPAMTELESKMRIKADHVAEQINQILESKS